MRMRYRGCAMLRVCERVVEVRVRHEGIAIAGGSLKLSVERETSTCVDESEGEVLRYSLKSDPAITLLSA